MPVYRSPISTTQAYGRTDMDLQSALLDGVTEHTCINRNPDRGGVIESTTEDSRERWYAYHGGADVEARYTFRG